jgi:hypothetical protein
MSTTWFETVAEAQRRAVLAAAVLAAEVLDGLADWRRTRPGLDPPSGTSRCGVSTTWRTAWGWGPARSGTAPRPPCDRACSARAAADD